MLKRVSLRYRYVQKVPYGCSIPRPHLPRQSSGAMLVLPLALIVAVTVTSLLLPPYVHLGPLLVAVPALAASFTGPRGTGLTAVLAVAMSILLGMRDLRTGDPGFPAQMAALVVISAIALVTSHLRHRRGQELAQVRTVAEAAQRALLRPLPRRVGPLRVASVYLAAEAEAHIGGDLYAVAPTMYGTRLIIGDACGKGLAAVSDAALLLGAFREAAHRLSTLPELVASLEESVSRTSAEGDGEAGVSFVTAAVLDTPAEPVLRLVSCGHPPPLLFRKGRITALEATTPALPLGMGGLASQDYHVETVRYEVGDMLLLYTDGVIEARDSAGTFYPLIERASSWNHDSPEALVQHIRTDLLAHVDGRLSDDAALVAVKRLAP